ncbi:MAG: D-alanyl-D-alanine carboxypeptidase family protein [Corynebacterium sp.]|nr:D-alanyl-D-alanine carboxypeptidase family protein [Corynebacterium sp.]
MKQGKISAAIVLSALCCATIPISSYAQDAPVFEVEITPAPRSTSPDTNRCPNAERPPKAVTTSERVAPGMTSPTPLPQVTNEFGTCGITKAAGFVVPDLTASSWLVWDLDSGEVLGTKDPHGRYRPASIIKVLLAMEVINNLDLNKVVTVSAESANQEGSAVGIGPGGKYSIRDLLYGLLLQSGNDAAHALAQELGGNEQALKRVNALAHKLGAADTYAASYSGLDAPGMSTSAHDMALFYTYAWQNPTFAQIVRTDQYNFPGYKDNPGWPIGNDNGLLMNDPDGLGGKTGFTSDANHTFVGAKKVGNRRLAAVILDTTVDKGRPWQQAQKLIDDNRNVTASIGKLSAGTTATVATPGMTMAPSSTASTQPAPENPKAVGSTEGTYAQATRVLKQESNRTVVLVGGFCLLLASIIGVVLWRRDRARK